MGIDIAIIEWILLKIDTYKDGILKDSIEKHICTKIEEKNEVGQISSKNFGRMLYVHLRMVCMDSLDFFVIIVVLNQCFII